MTIAVTKEPLKQLEWVSRCKKDSTDVATRKHYDSTCKRYRVTYSESTLGLPSRSYSLVLNDQGVYALIKVHVHYRHTETAFRECEEHHLRRLAAAKES